MKPALLITLFGILCIAACKKSNGFNPSIKAQFKANALIRNYGTPAADGCGWMLVTTDNKILKPDNLDQAFLKDSLKVELSYDTLQMLYQCGFNPNSKFRHIQIKSIGKSE